MEQCEWKDIWDRKGSDYSGKIELSDLIAIDGFDTGAGEFSVDSWISFVKDIEKQLGLKEGQKVLEVGCGSGAFLFPMYQSNIRVYGVDYSASLAELCSKVMREGVFKTASAESLPFENSSFDTIVSNSVFQYFRSLDYAEKVVDEMDRVLKSEGNVAILDVNDASKKQEYESIRKGKLGEGEYKRLYGKLSHQFYPKEWFESIAKNLNLSCDIQDQNIPGYANSQFRYNVLLSRKD